MTLGVLFPSGLHFALPQLGARLRAMSRLVRRSHGPGSVEEESVIK